VGGWVMGVLQAVKLKLQINISRMTSSYTNTRRENGSLHFVSNREWSSWCIEEDNNAQKYVLALKMH
jgi:hypothetical protein